MVAMDETTHTTMYLALASSPHSYEEVVHAALILQSYVNIFVLSFSFSFFVIYLLAAPQAETDSLSMSVK